jgi:peptidoglycan/LPS O-acetylase OafA/YrhL
LVASLTTGLVMLAAGKLDLLARWPASRTVAYLGRTSYSMFLVHFPVLVVILTLWVRLDWISAAGAITSLVAAYIGSLVVAVGFYHFIERPSERLTRTVA